MKNILVVILLFISTVVSAGNHPDNSIKQMETYQHQADKFMEDFDVNSAIPLYQKALAIKTSPAVVRNLAMCYFYRGYYKKVLLQSISLRQTVLTIRI